METAGARLVGGWVVVRGGGAHLGVCLLLVGRAQLAPIALDLALGHGGQAARLAPEEHGPGAASEEQAAAAALEAAEPTAHRPPPQQRRRGVLVRADGTHVEEGELRGGSREEVGVGVAVERGKELALVQVQLACATKAAR